MRYRACLADEVGPYCWPGVALRSGPTDRTSTAPRSTGSVKEPQDGRDGCPSARSKFTGSGGAIVGTYADEAIFRRLIAALEPLGRCCQAGHHGESMTIRRLSYRPPARGSCLSRRRN
jgi:hypothetical protein